MRVAYQWAFEERKFQFLLYLTWSLIFSLIFGIDLIIFIETLFSDYFTFRIQGLNEFIPHEQFIHSFSTLMDIIMLLTFNLDSIEHFIYDSTQNPNLHIVKGNKNTAICLDQICMGFITNHQGTRCKLRCFTKHCIYYLQCHDPTPCTYKCKIEDCRFYTQVHSGACEKICRDSACKYFLQFHFGSCEK
jgi:hypothetical protein